MMTNPWRGLTNTAPYVLDGDRRSIELFNRTARDEHQARLEIIPEPYLGDPSAPVVLLNANPGFVETDKVVHFDPVFNAAARANLEHRAECPFYLLDESLPPSPGLEWWMKKLRSLIQATSREAVSRRVFVAELHGYHSKRFSPRLRVESQEYTRALVRAAVARGAEIVVMRSYRHWLTAVPELGTATRLSRVTNVQNPTISPGNLAAFAKIVDAIG